MRKIRKNTNQKAGWTVGWTVGWTKWVFFGLIEMGVLPKRTVLNAIYDYQQGETTTKQKPFPLSLLQLTC